MGSFVVLLCVVTAGAGHASANHDDLDDDYGATVRLSPLEVTASRIEFVNWIKVQSPHFVVYSDADISEAIARTKQMEMLRQGVLRFFRREAMNRPPTIVVLPTAWLDWRRITAIGGQEWEAAITAPRGVRDVVLASCDWQNTHLHPVWGSIGNVECRALNLDGPLWFHQGIYSFFRKATFDGNHLTIGRREVGPLTPYDMLPLLGGWMKWDRFFSVDRKSAEWLEASDDRRRYVGQAEAVIYFVLTNRDPQWTAKLLAWAAFLEAGNRPTEAKFVEFFGMSWSPWQRELERLRAGGRYQSGTVHFPPEALEIPTQIETPRIREMRELLVLSQIRSQRTKDSELALDALLTRGLKTESLRELLADACWDWNRPRMALRELRALILDRSSNPSVYARAAQLVYTQQLGRITLESRLDEPAWTEIRNWCEQALAMEPRHVQANEVMAWSEAFAPDTQRLDVNAVARAADTCVRLARKADVLMAVAIAHWREGHVDEARAVAQQVASGPWSTELGKRLAGELLSRTAAEP